MAIFGVIQVALHRFSIASRTVVNVGRIAIGAEVLRHTRR